MSRVLGRRTSATFHAASALVGIASVVVDTACSSESSCGGGVVIPAFLVVVNDTTGGRICDATATVAVADATRAPDAQAGPYVLQAYAGADGGPVSCYYAGPPFAAPGTYSVTVSKPGFQIATASDIEVKSYPCDAPPRSTEPMQVTVRLKPTA